MVSIDDRKTRGKTRPGRLRMVDRWLAAELEAGAHPNLIVDIGAGEHAWTTKEMAAAVRPLLEDVQIIAVENDERRAAQLRAESDGQFDVIASGFDLPIDEIGFIRCMNVLRQYPVDQAAPTYRKLRGFLAEDGLLACGTTDARGDIGTFWRYSAGERSLVVFTTGERGFAPRQFRDFLPRDIRRLPAPENAFLDWLPQWEAAWNDVRDQSPATAAFEASIQLLEASGSARLVAPGIAELALK